MLNTLHRIFVLNGISLLLVSSTIVAGIRGNITGKITNRATGDPLVGATISVLGTNHRTKANLGGEYRILGVPVGNYTLRAALVGFGQVDVIRVRVIPNKTTSQKFTLIEDGHTGGVMVSGYNVSLIPPDTVRIIPPSPEIGWDSLQKSFFLPKNPNRRQLKDILILTEIYFDSLGNIDSVSVPSENSIFYDVINEGLRSTLWLPATKRGYPVIYKLSLPLLFYLERAVKPLLIKAHKPPKRPNHKF